MVEDAPKNSSGRSESRLTPPGTLRSLGDEASKSALRAIQAAQAQFLGGSELDDAALPLLDWCRTGAVCDFAALIRLDPTDERSDRLAVTTVPEMLDQPGMIDSGEQGAGSLRGLDPSALRHSLTLGDQVRAPWITNHTHAAAVAPIARCLGDCRELAVYPLSSPDGISGAICLTRRSEPFQPDDLRSLEPVIDQLHLMVRATSAERTAQSSERVHEHDRTRIEGIIAAVRLCTWEWDFQTDELRFDEVDASTGKLNQIRSTGTIWHDRIHPEDQPRVKRALDEHLAGAPYFFAEYRLQREAGIWSSILASGAVSRRDASGVPTSIWGIYLDNSRQRQAEEEQARSHGLLQQIVDALPQRVFWKDLDGRYLGANLAFRIDSGCNPVGLDDFEMPWTREQAEFFRECDRRVASTGRPEMNIVEPILTDDGEQRWLSTSKMPLRDAHDTVFGVLGTYLDITAIKENEVELARARDAAEEASRAKGEFLATMSHEIRTPLNGILGYLDLVLESRLDPEQEESIATARTSGITLLHIINDILDFSKLEAGKFELEEKPFQLRPVVAEAVELLAPQAYEQGVELALIWEDGVPEMITGDVHRLRQVLTNLIGNAVKFSEDAPITVQIDAPAEGQIRFQIIDRGVGIPLEKRAHVFQKFSQVDSSPARRFGGTGLGLAISKRLVEAMGGEIGFESDLGVGTTFWFTLRVPTGNPTPRSDEGAGKRVLVASPVGPIVQSLRLELNRRGFEVTTAASLPDARAILASPQARPPFDVLIIDAALGKRSGLGALQSLRDQGFAENGCLTLLAARHSHFQSADFQQAGIRRTIAKPFTRPSQLEGLLGTDQANAIADAAAERPGLAVPALPARRELRVLLAEDNVINQKLARRMLEQSHCSVDLADNGREAVEMAAQHTYDVIFMDCQMPEMDGYTATGVIRRLERSGAFAGTDAHVRIVALTANALTGDRERCIAAGMDDYIPKPFHRSDLERVLDEVARSEANEG